MKAECRAVGMAVRAAILLFAGSPAIEAAQTTATVHLGGPGSFGSDGSFDPATLADGVTLASAETTFTLDDTASTLTLVVDNTSPVTPGVPNPLLTRVWFNVPVTVTAMTLLSQTAAGGADPDFDLQFDPRLLDGSNPNGAAPFGSFSALLVKSQGGMAGGIANPLAGTLPGPPGSQVLGPVTFTFGLSGDLTGLTAETFTRLYSVTPPGNLPRNAAGKFQGGGEDESSGRVSDGSRHCNPVLLVTGVPRLGETIHIVLNGAPGCHGCLVLSLQPGPTVLPEITLDVGPEFLEVVLIVTFGPQALIDIPVEVPIDPKLVGLTFYAQLVTGGPGGTLEKSNRVEVTVTE